MTARDPRPIAEALLPILGDLYLLTDQAACAAYAVQGVAPGCVAAPANIDELAAVLRTAQELRAAVVPWGGGTQQLIGNPPEQADLVVRTERLCQVLIHEPFDLAISVEAGMTLGALRAHLARHGQMLPVDPALPERATIGGLIATAADGPRRLGYGTLRDLLIGIAVVEAGGRLSKAGGMVVKNVSGFDMMKLYLGSFGTLAVIASANFKLLPAPRAAATLLCVFDTPTSAFAALEALQLTQLTPTAAEYLNAGALQSLGLAGACALALRAEGLEAAVERHMADMAALVRRNAARDSRRLDGPAESDLWARIADLPQAMRIAGDEALLKLAVLPAEIERAVAQIEALAADRGQGVALSARGLNGVIYARVRPVDANGLEELRQALPAVQWIATMLPQVSRWGTAPPGLELMRRIKHEFDPLRILNRGRYVEGI
jgi:glycolate oxidase FAD binding subunit